MGPKRLKEPMSWHAYMERDKLIDPLHELLYYVTRDEWGAAPYTSDSGPTNIHPVNHLRFQYTNTEECFNREDCSRILRELQKEHMEKINLPDIQYNFMIGSDGSIFEGRGWFRNAYRKEKHDYMLDRDMINIGFIGKFKEKALPMKMEIQAINLGRFGQTKGYVMNDVITYMHTYGNIDFTDY